MPYPLLDNVIFKLKQCTFLFKVTLLVINHLELLYILYHAVLMQYLIFFFYCFTRCKYKNTFIPFFLPLIHMYNLTYGHETQGVHFQLPCVSNRSYCKYPLLQLLFLLTSPIPFFPLSLLHSCILTHFQAESIWSPWLGQGGGRGDCPKHSSLWWCGGGAASFSQRLTGVVTSASLLLSARFQKQRGEEERARRKCWLCSHPLPAPPSCQCSAPVQANNWQLCLQEYGSAALAGKRSCRWRKNTAHKAEHQKCPGEEKRTVRRCGLCSLAPSSSSFLPEQHSCCLLVSTGLLSDQNCAGVCLPTPTLMYLLSVCPPGYVLRPCSYPAENGEQGATKQRLQSPNLLAHLY